MELTAENIAFFEERTGFNLNPFLQSYVDFYAQNYQSIVDFYNGDAVADSQAFALLFDLVDQASKIIQIASSNSQNLNNFQGWVVLDLLEQVRTNLLSIVNIAKYIRSALSKNEYSQDSFVSYAVKQNQTLENVSQNVEDSDLFDDEWSDIAIRNRLREEDYTPNESLTIDVSTGVNDPIFVSTVIDTINGETILGKDVDQKVQFIEGNLKVLSSGQTYEQSIDILLNMSIRSNPQYPELGWDKSFVVGQNINSVAYPSFLRQLTQNVRTDDTISSVEVLKIEQRGLQTFIEVRFTSIAQDVLTSSALIG